MTKGRTSRFAFGGSLTVKLVTVINTKTLERATLIAESNELPSMMSAMILMRSYIAMRPLNGKRLQSLARGSSVSSKHWLAPRVPLYRDVAGDLSRQLHP